MSFTTMCQASRIDLARATARLYGWGFPSVMSHNGPLSVEQAAMSMQCFDKAIGHVETMLEQAEGDPEKIDAAFSIALGIAAYISADENEYSIARELLVRMRGRTELATQFVWYVRSVADHRSPWARVIVTMPKWHEWLLPDLVDWLKTGPMWPHLSVPVMALGLRPEWAADAIDMNSVPLLAQGHMEPFGPVMLCNFLVWKAYTGNVSGGRKASIVRWASNADGRGKTWVAQPIIFGDEIWSVCERFQAPDLVRRDENREAFTKPETAACLTSNKWPQDAVAKFEVMLSNSDRLTNGATPLPRAGGGGLQAYLATRSTTGQGWGEFAPGDLVGVARSIAVTLAVGLIDTGLSFASHPAVKAGEEPRDDGFAEAAFKAHEERARERASKHDADCDCETCDLVRDEKRTAEIERAEALMAENPAAYLADALEKAGAVGLRGVLIPTPEDGS